MINHIGNVIRILDKFTVIVNTGSYELSVGDKIQIYETLDDVVDLDGKKLDSFTYIKDELKVIQVESNYSVCQKEEIVTRSIPLFPLSPLLEKTVDEKVPLNVKDSELDPLPSVDKAIHVGDKVKKMA